MDIGFVGLGNMGGPMALNMAKKGHKLTIHDLRKESAIDLLEMGANWADSPKDVVENNEIVFTSLPVPRDVETVVLGENGIVEGCSGDNIYVDLSTNSPTIIRRIHDECALKGIKVLDAPVSGGTYGAAAGTLAVMVGGDETVFKQIKPALDAIGSHVVYCGPIGNGMVTKICNNLISMGIGVLMAEALTLGVKAGMDLEVLADVITNSTGGNKRLADKFPRFLFEGNFEPGFATALAAKDVRLATDLGREYGIPMELSNLVDQRHVEALFRGWGPEDSDSVAKLQEEKSGIELRIKK
jgi:3-hydroxyisobutyrate dehydrogenase